MRVERLSKWSDVVAYLKARYREVEEFAGDRLRFTADHEGTAFAISAQLLIAGTGGSWVGFATKLGPVTKLRERSALVANLDLPIGAFAIVMDQAVLRQTLPLHALPPTHIAHTVQALIALTRELRHVAELEDVDIDTPYAYVFH